MRARAVLLSLLLAVAGLSVAAPASADHLAFVSPAGCNAGRLAGGFPGDTNTSTVVVRYGTDLVKTTCTFTGLPREYYNEDLGYLWTRVTRMTRVPVTGCVFTFPDGREVYGDGTATFTPGGTARVQCTFVPSRG